VVVTAPRRTQGLAGYLAILTEPRYATPDQHVLLARPTTIDTLVIATIAGLF